VANGSSGQAIQDAANAISQMRNDISAMVTDIRNMNSALSVTSSQASNVSGRNAASSFDPGGGSSSGGMDIGRIAMSSNPMLATVGEAVKMGFNTAKDAALASYTDLRIGREDALNLERQRLIARTGTGNFKNFQNNLNIAMNDINVQDRWAITKDLAGAMSSYYNQAMGGGIAGEQRASMAVGAMHTLASVAGIDASAVGAGTGALYSSQSYYKAMAAGIQTRNPVTGDMLQPEEIINQYRKRLARNTPEEIKRALGPGGTLRAELMQTWGDAGLVEMVSKGLVMSAEQGAPLRVGDIQSAAIKTGYAGTEWTQGKDTESLKYGAMQNRVAEYTNDVTAGLATTNTILADINAKIANLGGDDSALGKAMRKFVGATETFGGIMDQALIDMPKTTALAWDKLSGAISSLVNLATNPNPATFFGALSASTDFGALALGGLFVRSITAGASGGEPTPTPWVNSSGGAPVPPRSENYDPNLLTSEPAPQTGGLAVSSLSDGQAPYIAGTVNNNTVSINLTVSNASDAEAQKFAAKVQEILSSDEELAAAGEGKF
jgi:hypothetical protein